MSATVLSYVRPWNREQFTFLAEQLLPGARVVRASEHASIDEAGIVRRYHAYLHGPRHALNLPAAVSEPEARDVIARCRLLRTLSDQQARRHLCAMARAIEDVLEELAPTLVVSLIIDSYVMDLLHILVRARSIRFVAFIGTFVNGCYRISARGEANFFGDADPALVEELRHKLLADSYAPVFNSQSISSPRKSVYRRWAANIARVPWFWLKRVLGGDYHNYHYWVSQQQSLELLHWLPPTDPGDPGWMDKLKASSRPKVFIPLQMFPECTVDYWCQDLRVIDYYAVLDRLLDTLSKRFNVVIKEHPSVMGNRPTGFYSRLAKDPRVTVVPTYTPSNLVLKEADAVLVWTGSVGFESILRGKPVFGLAKPFYASGERFMTIDMEPDLDAMAEHIAHCQANPISVDEQNAILGHLASQLLRGDFINFGAWTADNPEHRAQIEGVVASYLSVRPISAG
ncbi:hypothetical protein HU719_003585 [Pseudomonas sp. SWRI107]|uniref:capsular polysaccharide export protein, LipB/KpsS family n=1 Tax=Pseudomonas farsensis TaxID=2745492 RepID=UPI001648B529|nr:hypothetical protein [Pseudomonas farsensis]MBV4530503.1 hypothetical protein [Pseudomonas farsensis]